MKLLLLNDSVTGPLPLGSAASPSLSFVQDSNTGIYSPGADQVAISTGGTGRLFIDASGNIGVGNSVSSLSFASGTGSLLYGASVTRFVIKNADTGTGQYAGFEMNCGTSGVGAFVQWQNQPITWITNNGSTVSERMRLTAAGNVGIGTNSPAAKIHSVVADGEFSFAARGTTKAIRFNHSATFSGIDGVDSTLTGSYQPLQISGSDVRFGIEGVEKVRIDSSGRLLVGTNASRSTAFGQSNFQIEADIAISALHSRANNPFGPAFVIGKTRGSSNEAVTNGDVLGIVSFQGGNGSTMLNGADITAVVTGAVSGGGANDLPTSLIFSTTADGAGSPTERMRIDSTGLVTLAGPGIKFPATQVASADPNTLDDYEEGTFTPTIFGGMTGGSTTYSIQTGRYTKVGRIVHIQLFVDWSSATGTGGMRIGGLPFTASSDVTYPAFAIGDANNITLTSLNVMTIRVEPSTANLHFGQYPVGGGASTAVGVDSAGYITVGGSYII
jgi:hypothetical protein